MLKNEDELLIGNEAYDASGRRRWQLEGHDAATCDPIQHHVNQAQVGRLGPDGSPEMPDRRDPRLTFALKYQSLFPA